METMTRTSTTPFDVVVLNNDTSAAPTVTLTSPTTIRDLFEGQFPGKNPDNYMITRNREDAAYEDLLTEGDLISFTPMKLEAARD